MLTLLLKTFLKERLSIRRLFGQKIARSKLQSWLMIGLLVYAFGVTMFSTVFLNYELGLGLQVNGLIDQLLFNGYSQLASLGFLFGFFQAQGYLFQYKDFDLLGPLPIPHRLIVSAKIAMMLIFVYIFSLFVVIPGFGVWVFFSQASVLQVLTLLSLFLVTPIPMMLLGSVVSFGIRKLVQRWVNASVLQTVFSVLFIFTFVVINYGLTTWLPSSWLQMIADMDVLGRWFVLAVAEFNPWSWLGFMAFHVSMLVGFILMMSGPLLVLNQQRALAHRIHIEKIPTAVKSVQQHLLHKEWHRFIGTSIYVMNTGFGVLILLVLAGWLLFFPGVMSDFSPILLELNVAPFWFVFAIIGFSLSTVYTPAVSLSLEGKNIGLLKTLPIRGWTIFQAKIKFNLWLTIPVITLAMVVSAWRFDLGWLVGLLGWVSLVLFALLLSIFFMMLNIMFPRFDFQHEVEVVKQSLAALIAVLGGFAILGGFLWFVFASWTPQDILGQLIALLALETGLIVAFGGYLYLRAETLYQSLTI